MKSIEGSDIGKEEDRPTKKHQEEYCRVRYLEREESNKSNVYKANLQMCKQKNVIHAWNSAEGWVCG